ncbi:uncharacterized protein [Amphiura filiformis]|uniref:uncharacterized protein isoform X1 n=1 Tax=Amphiura filiformis TaxID=82378 RepID=UPI003B225D8B
MATFEEVKPVLDEALQYLKTCSDFSTPQATKALQAIEWLKYEGVSYLVTQSFGQLFGRILGGLSGFLEREKWAEDGFANLELVLGACISLTDNSPELGAKLGTYGSIPLLFSALQKLETYFEQNEEFRIIKLLTISIFGILHNSIRLNCNSNCKIYRDAQAVGICKKYLKSQNALISTFSLMILAYVVDESESGILATSDGGVAILVQWLQEAINSDSHNAAFNWITGDASELLDCLNHLAINDSNKLEIEKQGGIPAIVRMLEDDFNEGEQCVAAEAVWNLAFVKSIRTSPQLQEAVPLLDILRKSTNRNLRKISGIAYWEINDNRHEDLPTRESTPLDASPSYEESMKEPKRAAANTVKVMISYQWDFKHIASEIRDDLVNNGYRVWMDVTHMRDDMLISMAEAVEKSEIILMFLSESYKNSQSCRTEAEYAYKLQKKVIPLLVQEDYKPDGWLGILQGMKLYYKFFSDDLTQTEMPLLLTALEELAQKGKAHDEHDGPITATQSTGIHASPPPSSKSSVRNWTENDVQDWLKKKKLGDLCDTLDDLEGSHLEKMYEKYCRDPTKFEDELRSDYQMSGKLCLKFTVALEKVFKN